MLLFSRLKMAMTLLGLANMGMRSVFRLAFLQKNGHGGGLDRAQFVWAVKRRFHRWPFSDIIQFVSLARLLALVAWNLFVLPRMFNSVVITINIVIL